VADGLSLLLLVLLSLLDVDVVVSCRMQDDGKSERNTGCCHNRWRIRTEDGLSVSQSMAMSFEMR